MDAPTLESARAHVAEALEQYVRCPAESDYENGFLGALYVIGVEALGMDLAPPDKLPPDNATHRAHLRIVK